MKYGKNACDIQFMGLKFVAEERNEKKNKIKSKIEEKRIPNVI